MVFKRNLGRAQRVYGWGYREFLFH
jgi:hypothetical protein